jgi:hypothetical protein
MPTKLTSSAALLSFRILDSRSGNITKPPFRKEGTELNFECNLNGAELEVKIISTTYTRNFFYQLITDSVYDFKTIQPVNGIFNESQLNTATGMVQYSLKRHSGVFQQFNYSGIFKNCSVQEKSFDDLHSMTCSRLQSLMPMTTAFN